MKKIKKIFKFFLIMFFIIFVIFLCVKSTNSKYISAEEIQVFSGIANPEFVVNTEEKKIIENLNLEKVYYEFSVKNFNEAQEQSEVKLKYNIFFDISQPNVPIKINLYKKTLNGNEIVNLENYKTVNSEILELNKIENKYIVEVFYDKTSSEIMNENLNISVIVQAVQKEV